MTAKNRLLWLSFVALQLLVYARVSAEPYIAVRTGLKCEACHVNPTGGGLRTAFGDAYAQTELPAKQIHTPWGLWTGNIGKVLRIGGDLRDEATVTQTPHTPTIDQFQLEQARFYLEASVVPDRLLFYVDEQVAPGGALNREAYALYWSAGHDWYVKAGQMYLPFAFRLADQSAFVYQVSGISMERPDQGMEVGWMRGHWDTQLTVSNGTAGGGVTSQGKEYGLQASYVQSRWRFGLAANEDDVAAGRDRVFGAFGGLRTGPVVWLGEADMIEDRSVPFVGRTQAATLLEADWLVSRGSNLKVTMEFLDPNRSVHNNGENRWSLVYEYFPVQFLQLRAGVRYYDGPPQVDVEHTKFFFVQLHGFF